MKTLIISLFLLLPVLVRAQGDVLTIDLQSPAPVAAVIKNDPSKFQIKVVNGRNMNDQTLINYTLYYGTTYITDRDLAYGQPFPLNITATSAGKPKPDDIFVTIVVWRNNSQQLLRKIRISPDKKVNEVQMPNAPDPVYYFTLRPIPDTAGVNEDLWKHNAIIFYRPDNNTYSIWNDKKQVRALSYKTFWRNSAKGVVVFVNNFNTLKYDIGLTSEFVNRFTDVPDLLNSASSLMSATKASAKATTLPEELSMILQLNLDLKRLLDTSFANFDDAKKQVFANAQLNFTSNDGIFGIDRDYNGYKKDFIKNNFPAPKPDPNPKADANAKAAVPNTVKLFNDTVQKMYHLPISPDSLVSETISLYNTLESTNFSFQSNVIQLQNSDELQLTINTTPKSTAKNTSFAITSQMIKIPVLGGIKVDFSSGFYYSGVKNETYSLQNITVSGDTAKKHIVKENDFNSGTAGVDALVHIYGRQWPAFNFSFTFGVGKALDLNYSVLAGGSLIFGRENRFALSGGFNFASIKALSAGNVGSNGQYIDLPGTATDVTYYNKFRTSWFAGLSYSFGTGSPKQSATATPAAATTDTSNTGSASPSGSGGKGTGGKSKGS